MFESPSDTNTNFSTVADKEKPSVDSGQSSLIEQMNKVEKSNIADAIQQKMIQMQLNQAKVDNERFFMMLAELMKKQLESAQFKEELEHIAQASGYPDSKTAVNNAFNQNGQSPLAFALQNQDFKTAERLFNEGANVTSIEKAIYNLARDSVAGREHYGLPQANRSEPLEDVKYFGLTLGIKMTDSNGVSSQYAHVGPTYQVMTDSVTKYAARHPDNPHFKEIADAFTTSNKEARFVNSTPHGNGAALSERIKLSGKVTTIPVNCKGHAMGLSFVPDGEPPVKSGSLVYTNRGLGETPGKFGTRIYRVEDSSKITPEFIRNMMNGHNSGASHDDIVSQIANVTDHQDPVCFIPQSAQKLENCTIANARANMHGILLAIRARERGGFDNLTEQDKADVKKEFKSYTTEMRQDKVDELVDKIRNNPDNENYKNIAKEYLKQHPKDAQTLGKPLMDELNKSDPEHASHHTLS
ncbi:Dot/Icm T4SS effector AnkD/LegA15 [Legionella waltersii]|uniref:Substrate of the Dot/Icm secretion system n=1 Tax=Legionella waltersii TaxID=66969 RepID=A0A0W1ANW6_9GAMM|nr:Dot/Icm T4SS effector AnkD/LegA15 [Legionella waltersii]KTD83005.1 substrate of the Dot/Icm secretion system [Legionella waltersii]SNV07583.1 Dot/Icm secretion system substrate [Legionella waltersii]